MNEQDKADIDRAEKLLIEANDIISNVANRQTKYVTHKYLTWAMDNISEAQLNLRDGLLGD